jgi:glycosyltransferase involved in cell wall biosynthesis
MAEMPLISIITVVRNDAERLRHTLCGLAPFKGVRTENIVVDGASTDHTLEVIKSLPEIVDRYISEPDKGIYDAMNKGTALARGDYLLFLNAGDELLTDLESLVSTVSGAPVMVYGKVNMYAADGSFLYLKGKRLKSINQFLKGMPLCHQGILYRRDCMMAYDLRYPVYADRALTYHLLCKHGLSQARFVDCIMVNFYEDGFSCTTSEDSLRTEQNEFYRHVGKEHYILIKYLKAQFKQKVKLPLQRLTGRRPRN